MEKVTFDKETIKAVEKLERRFVLEKGLKDGYVSLRSLDFLVGATGNEIDSFYIELEEKGIQLIS